MRISRSAWVFFWIISSCCLMFVSCCAGGEGEKEKPKEKPFKYDAWCAFSDLIPDRQYIPPNAPIDPDSDHVRPGVEKLGGFGRRGQWAHVIVDLKNTTDPKDKILYDGFSNIIFDNTKPDDLSQPTYGTAYRQAFQVAPQTEKPYHFSIFCPESGWNETRIAEIVTSSNRPYSRSFKIHDLDARNEQLIVVVSDQPGAFKYLGPRVRNRDDPDAGMGPEDTGRQVASVTPSELPARWHDLALASLIIIDGPPAGGLSAEQWDAIKSYAQSGGKVLIMAGKDPNRLKGAVEDLAGIVVRNSAELPSLDQFKYKFPLADEKNKELRVPIIEVTAPGAGIVKRNTATQIVEYSAKSYGAGMVAFIPFSLTDRMFEGWPDRETIPLNLVHSEKNLFSISVDDELSNAAPADPYNTSNYPAKNRQTSMAALRNALDTSFVSDTPVITQSPQTVLWFVSIYLACAVPLNYAVFFFLRRREAAWLMGPVWACGFAIAAYYLGYSGQTGVVTVNEVCVIEAGSGQGTGIGRTFMGVYAPRRGDYQIEFPLLDNGYDTQAAPTHLVNTETMEKRGQAFPTMHLREEGEEIKIEDILIQTRGTRQFEIQHRAWLKDGLVLKFSNTLGAAGDQAAAFGVSPGATIRITNNTGRALFNPVFIKNGKYLELAPRDQRHADFEAGKTLESNSFSNEWHSLDESFIEKFTAHFGRSGDSKHVETRAKAVTAYFRQHMKQYAAGVFVAWADGAALPVRIGPAGSKTDDPNLEGITLLVVPAEASNRGGRDVSLKKNPPRALYATAYSPEDRSSGEWKLGGRDRIPVNAPDEQKQKCVYLRLQFDPDFGQYVYEGKAAQLTFSVAMRSARGQSRFIGELNVLARIDAAKNKNERFKQLGDPTAMSLSMGMTKKITPMKFQFTSTELFTGSSIILKVRTQTDDGTPPPDGLVLENVDLQLVDK